MKICFITTVSLTVKSFLLPVLSYFRENTDWELSVICSDDPELEKLLPPGVRYFPVKMERGISLGGIAACAGMYRIFRKEKFDMVQYSTPNAGLYAAIAAWLSGIRHRKYHLMGFRFLGFSCVKRRLFMYLEKLSCRLSTDIECVSNSNLELGIQMGIFPKAKANVLYYGSSAGIDLGRFDIQKKQEWRQSLRAKFGYTDRDCVFGYAGRITRDKGINELLSSFDKMEADNKKLFLIGRIENESQINPVCLQKARNSALVRFHDQVDDIEKYYAMMDVLLLPSYREGFGNIIIEAEALGVPVIVTDIPGPTDAMERDITGLVVPVKDTMALQEAMCILASDPEKREKMGQAGYCFAVEKFDQKVLLAKILENRKHLFGEK